MTEILTFCTKKVINGAENNFSGIFFGNEFTKICAREDELFGQGYGNVLLFFVGSYTCSCLMSTTHVDRSGGGGEINMDQPIDIDRCHRHLSRAVRLRYDLRVYIGRRAGF